MVKLPDAAKAVVESDALAHVVTLNADGSPHVTIAWAGLDGEEIVMATMVNQRKLSNVRRDPRICLSFQTDKSNEMGLREYLVVYGTARLTEGGAADLLQHLAHTYLGPGVKFPPFDDPPPGFVTHVTVDRIGGVGRWTERA